MSQSKFVPQLEALRGIAAMCVVAEHSFVPMTPFRVGMFSNPADYQEVLQWGTHTLFNGRSAVILFFVLSGYVLKNQWGDQGSQGLQKYAAYVLRRVFRIIPALWLSVLFGYVCALYFGLPVAHGFNNFIGGLLLRDISLNLPLWTIVAELYCSLFFPAVIWLHTRSKAPGRIAIMVLLLAGFVFGDIFALRFLMFFYCGLLIHDYGGRFVRSLGAWRWTTLAVALTLYCAIPQLWVFENNILTLTDGVFYQILLAVPCFAILSIIVHGQNPTSDKLLLSRPARLVGKVSYSLYLFHYIIAQVFWQTFLNLVSAFWPYYYFVELAFFLCIAALSLVAATAVYFMVEKPANKYGRELGYRVAASASAVHAAS